MIRLSQPIIDDEEINAIVEVLKSGMLVQGNYVSEFETALKQYIDVDYVSAVSSGTAALHTALSALGVGEGDAVFVPSFTFPATANVVELQRARTVLVDVDISTYNIDIDLLEKAIINYSEPETPKAIIVVHEFGAPANMTRIMEIAKKYNLFVVEDAACALGTKWNGQHVGTFGDIGCFSWHPRKAITTGEGGAIVTNNPTLFSKVNLLRNHGLMKAENGVIDFVIPGFNYRLTEIQAVLGINQLKKFDGWLKKRNELVEYYYELLIDVPNIKLPLKVSGHAWQTFMILLDEKINRDDLIKRLKVEGIETNLGAQGLSQLSYFKEKYDFDVNYNVVSNGLFKQGLALPLHPLLTKKDLDYICSRLNKNLI